MPYADPERKKEAMKRWRAESIKNGYGKALYARRAARYRNEEILREAVEYLLSTCDARLRTSSFSGSRMEQTHLRFVIKTCKDALKNAPPIGPPKDYIP